jgi:hypothetical protein
MIGCCYLNFYTEFKQLQPFIGSVVGFLALLMGALYNAKLNRERDEKVRDSEARSVATAIYNEMIVLRREVADRARTVAAIYARNGTERYKTAFDDHFLKANQLSEPMIYNALLPKIGLLEANLLAGVVRFYYDFQQVRWWLSLQKEDKDRGYNYSISSVLLPARDAVREALPTLRLMQQSIQTSISPEDYNLGLTDSLIEDDEAF